MRIAISLFALASSARVCGSEPTPPPPATPPVTVTASANLAKTPAAPTHGGTVVVVDDVQLELVVKNSGEVVAYPVVVAGAAVVPPAADIEVTLPVTTGAPRPVRLAWSPRTASFEGRVVNATVVPAPANVDVRIVHEGRVRRARAPRVVVVPATVVVDAPSPRVVVTAPPPPVVVVPPPPGVVVRGRGPNVDVRVAPPSVDVRVNVPGVRVEVDHDHHHDEHHHHGMHDHGRHLGWGMGRGHGMHRH